MENTPPLLKDFLPEFRRFSGNSNKFGKFYTKDPEQEQ